MTCYIYELLSMLFLPRKVFGNKLPCTQVADPFLGVKPFFKPRKWWRNSNNTSKEFLCILGGI